MPGPPTVPGPACPLPSRTSRCTCRTRLTLRRQSGKKTNQEKATDTNGHVNIYANQERKRTKGRQRTPMDTSTFTRGGGVLKGHPTKTRDANSDRHYKSIETRKGPGNSRNKFNSRLLAHWRGNLALLLSHTITPGFSAVAHPRLAQAATRFRHD